MIEAKKIIRQEEQAILVGLVYKEQTEPMVNEYLDELAFLAETAGAVAVKRFTQKLPHPDSKIFVGKGKLEEIKQFILLKGNISLVIFDDELTGSQIQNIEKELNVKYWIFLPAGPKPPRLKHRLSWHSTNIFYPG